MKITTPKILICKYLINKKAYISALLFGTAFSIHSQEVQWQKDIKSNTQDFLSPICITLDGQYLISGSSIQKSQPTTVSSDGAAMQNNGYDFHLVKLNQQGEQVWEKYFAGNNHDFLSATVATQEGGFLVAGTSNSAKSLDKKGEGKGGSDIWLLKLAENGNEEWQQTLGTANDDEARAVIQTTDLGYFVAGTTTNLKKGFGSKDSWVIRLDKTGKKTFESVLGGRGLDEVEKMIPTVDGGALLGIYSRSTATTGNKTETNTDDKKNPIPVIYTAKTSDNYGEGDYWVVKLSKEGKVEWQKNFGGKGDDHLRTLNMTGSGFIVGGESRSERSGNKSVGAEEGTDVWLVALNERGEEQWQKSYTFGNRDVMMSLNVINHAKDNVTKGFLLGGYTQAEGRMEKDDETFWMLYLNGDGNEVWRKHVKGESRKKEERLVDLKMNKDGSIILAGTSAEELGKENWKIVKLGDKLIDDIVEKQDIKIYPNPVEDYCYVEIGFEFKDATIELYDMGGRLVNTLKTKNRVTKISTQGLPQGAYLVIAKTETETANAKIIKK
ncbi:T9SS type A sorting domain-containing protein [Chryseobacterium sp.]|uniref:T9SS type A sorting domain-containing protein n=1 Tax=Chryseobacterium sp. TaxID=1871047 RepID=UPI0011CB64FD|nr:T9SS type A sorting domain-containing protein [Chryseobacterium sp.]TXF77771.1 T9SS type A sorting domain-containing protein [Chryseobacterium sp.]